jgi:uncharacterized OsmC-like protein
MSRDPEIRAAIERVVSVFRRKPEAALSSKKASGRLEEGLVCRLTSDGPAVAMDMPKVLGGGESAPSPGYFIRAGLIGCVAIGIKLTAVREGIDIDAIDVDVEMDFDDGAMLAEGTNSAAPLETRLTIRIESAAPWDVVAAMVDRALDSDPYYLAFRDRQNIKADVAPKAR